MKQDAQREHIIPPIGYILSSIDMASSQGMTLRIVRDMWNFKKSADGQVNVLCHLSGWTSGNSELQSYRGLHK